MRNFSRFGSISSWLCFLFVGACSSEPDSGAEHAGATFGSGGMSAPGVIPSAGGALPGAGGFAVGGANPGGAATGGAFVTGAGGIVAMPSSGGFVGAGGFPATGGDVAAGGAVTGGAGPGGAASTGGTTGATGSLPPVTSVDQDGPFTVTIDDKAGANSWVFRPTELGKDGVKHPIFVWGTGATSVPSQYTDHFNRVASHGFVVISPNSPQVSAAMLKASLDWILAEAGNSSSLYYQKLDTAKVAMGGHSLGSVGTFDAEATETRLTTTIHIAGGSFDGAGSSKVKTPTAYICGASGDFALANCQRDFQNVGSQPTFFSQLSGVNHVDAARAALPGMVAWLRWHLAGETERKAMFTGPSGQFFTGIWQSQTKNW